MSELEQILKEYSSHGTSDNYLVSVDDMFSWNPAIRYNPSETEFYVENITFFDFGPRKMILVLKHPAKLYLKGTLEIECISGYVDIHGHSLTPNKRRPFLVISGHGQSAVCLSSAYFYHTYDDELEFRLGQKKIRKRLRKQILEVSGAQSVLIVSRPVDLPVFGLFEIVNLLPPVDPPKKVTKNIFFPKAEEWFKCKFDIPSGRRIKQKMIYHPILLKFSTDIINLDETRIMVCGGKGVGKSTTLHYLINRMLDKWMSVFVVDFDIGQPEFTVPGCISLVEIDQPLLGPKFTHFSKPLRLINLGHVNPELCLTDCFNAIKELSKICNESIFKQGMPVFINTMGFVKGFGLELLTEIISSFRLTHVVQINSAMEPSLNGVPLTLENISQYLEKSPQKSRLIRNYKLIAFSQKIRRILVIPPRISREVRVLAYFYITRTDATWFIKKMSLELKPPEEKALFKSDKIVAFCTPCFGSNLSECIGHGIVLEQLDDAVLVITPLSEEELSSDFDIFVVELGLEDVLWNELNLFKKDISQERIIILGEETHLSTSFLFE